MGNNFSDTVEKIVNNYMNRLKSQLKGLPEQDQEELTKEVHSHIYESFQNDSTENEIDRILNVLSKLGEPADVISTRIPEAMVKMGKKRKLPFYILMGFLIMLFGIPLGGAGFSLLAAVFIIIGAVILTYYALAITFVLGGWITAVICIIRLFSPEFLRDYVHVMDWIPDPTLESILGLISGIILGAIGFLMLWGGKYLMRGATYLFTFPFRKIKDSRQKRRKSQFP